MPKPTPRKPLIKKSVSYVLKKGQLPKLPKSKADSTPIAATVPKKGGQNTIKKLQKLDLGFETKLVDRQRKKVSIDELNSRDGIQLREFDIEHVLWLVQAYFNAGGMNYPIEVDRDYRIIAGHHRYAAWQIAFSKPGNPRRRCIYRLARKQEPKESSLKLVLDLDFSEILKDNPSKTVSAYVYDLSIDGDKVERGTALAMACFSNRKSDISRSSLALIANLLIKEQSSSTGSGNSENNAITETAKLTKRSPSSIRQALQEYEAKSNDDLKNDSEDETDEDETDNDATTKGAGTSALGVTVAKKSKPSNPKNRECYAGIKSKLSNLVKSADEFVKSYEEAPENNWMRAKSAADLASKDLPKLKEILDFMSNRLEVYKRKDKIAEYIKALTEEDIRFFENLSEWQADQLASKLDEKTPRGADDDEKKTLLNHKVIVRKFLSFNPDLRKTVEAIREERKKAVGAKKQGKKAS